MTTTDTGINDIMMPLFLQVLASTFMDKHKTKEGMKIGGSSM